MAGTVDGQIFISTNDGNTWTNKSDGMGSFPITAFLVSGPYVFAGTLQSGSVWRRHIQEIVNIRMISSVVPNNYSLSQNFPNPFNPVTNIRLAIPSKTLVILKIYDIVGKEIITLINQELIPGSYNLPFDGSNFPSGIFFYTLYTDNFTETKKMLLLK